MSDGGTGVSGDGGVSDEGDLSDEAGLSEEGDQPPRGGWSLGEFASQLRALGDGRPDDAGTLPGVARRIADQLERLSERASERGLVGIADEVAGWIWRSADDDDAAGGDGPGGEGPGPASPPDGLPEGGG